MAGIKIEPFQNAKQTKIPTTFNYPRKIKCYQNVINHKNKSRKPLQTLGCGFKFSIPTQLL